MALHLSPATLACHSTCRYNSVSRPVALQILQRYPGRTVTAYGFHTSTSRPNGCGHDRKLVVKMAIRGVNFDAHVTLEAAHEEALLKLLKSPTFCRQVATQTKQLYGVEMEYAGHLFQPVPWSPTTKRGMPAELEHLLDDPSHVVINVPPNFMFSAKISSPTRLCAVYRKR